MARKKIREYDSKRLLKEHFKRISGQELPIKSAQVCILITGLLLNLTSVLVCTLLLYLNQYFSLHESNLNYDIRLFINIDSFLKY